MICKPIKKTVGRVSGTWGFTLIETLLAISVLTVSIMGPLTIASRGLNAALMAKNKTVAFYLAQDAIEFVRYKRDSNTLNSQLWLTGLESCISSDGAIACKISSISKTIDGCGAGCPVLNFDSSTHIFSYDAVGGTIAPTIFTRRVLIKTPVGIGCPGGVKCNDEQTEAEVKIEVSWKDFGRQVTPHVITVQENIFNWQ